MHLSYNELHRQAGKLSFCHRNIAGNHNIEGQHQQLVWLQCLRQTLLVNLLMEKFYPWTSTLFQGSRTGDKLLLRFSMVTCLSSTSSSVQWKFCCKINYTVGVVPSLCSRPDEGSFLYYCSIPCYRFYVGLSCKFHMSQILFHWGCHNLGVWKAWFVFTKLQILKISSLEDQFATTAVVISRRPTVSPH